jgi:hypothetical protein
MTPQLLTCPYCSTAIQVRIPDIGGPHFRCPHCHQVIPAPHETNNQPGHHAAESSSEQFRAGPPPAEVDLVPMPVRWSNRDVARVILSIMAIMAVAGLYYALVTTKFRRANDHREVKETFTPPALLPGLAICPGTSI